MLLGAEVYPRVLRWVERLGFARHRTAREALAELVTALLVAQSLQSAELMRAFSSLKPLPARQRYKRLQRALERDWLLPASLTASLVAAALALVPPDPEGTLTAGLTHLALDSVRCGGWEVFTLGVVWEGRVLIVGWAVLPYPWPKGTFRRTVCALLRQVAACWPADRPAHLVADRAFPSYDLLRAVGRAGWGCTLRLQARHHLTLGGVHRQVKRLLAEAEEGVFKSYAGAYGVGAKAVAGTLVVGRGLVVLPAHQANPGSLRARAERVARRAQHVATKHGGAPGDTDRWVVLFTSHADPLAAQASYARRYATEGTYRDGQGGWDGCHGWQLERVIGGLADAGAVLRRVGLWALGTLLQTWLGHSLSQPDLPALVPQTAAQWTTTGRLSLWARGQFALCERSDFIKDWVLQSLAEGAERLADRPPRPPNLLALPRRRSITPRKAA